MKVTIEFELDEYWKDCPEEELLDELIDSQFSAGVISTTIIQIKKK